VLNTNILVFIKSLLLWNGFWVSTMATLSVKYGEDRWEQASLHRSMDTLKTT